MQTVKKTGGVFRTATVLLLCCFFLLFVICPLGAMLLNLGKADLGALLQDGSIRTAAGHSLLVSLCATVISIAVAAVAAVCVSRTAVRLKSFFSVLILLPMLIPSISHGMGLTILFGQNGTLTKLLGMQNGIYGFPGIVVGSVMYAFPVAFLMICDILRYEDATPYEAARVLGIGKARRFCAITLPYLTKPMLNSVLIACGTALLGTATAFLSACFTARDRALGSRFLHLMSILSLAIPGIVLGLSYVLFFSGTFLYATLAILILANTIHFFSSPYLMMYNSIGKLSPNLEAAAATLGIKKARLIFDIILPQTRSTLAEMFSYFFVNSMMTISAVAFLATLTTKPIALMIPQFEAQMLLEASAFVSVLILAANLLLKGAVALLKRGMERRRTTAR